MPEVDVMQARSELELFRTRVYKMKLKFEEGKRINKERETLEAKMVKVQGLRRNVEILTSSFAKLYAKCMEEDVAFKNRRMDYLSEYITRNLRIIFPYEEFTAVVKNETKRNVGRATLTLVDVDGHRRIPHMSEGKLLQELISFSSSFGVVQSLGAQKLYLDEGFAASSPDNLSKLARLIDECAESGKQIIMIEQNPEGYKDIKRREIRLAKDPVTKKVVLVGIFDY